MRNMAQDLATSLLALSGQRAIADLHTAAALARDLGRPDIAESLAEIAEAAERQWTRRLEAMKRTGQKTDEAGMAATPALTSPLREARRATRASRTG